MNTALIFAGGAGQRMNSRSKPKQFIELRGKPIIIYTLEHFEAHPKIDCIVVACLKGWINELQMLLTRYNIHKVNKIVPGGVTGFESIYKALASLANVCADDDIVLIHDGVRPFITKELISANIKMVAEYGAVITVEPATESVVRSKDGMIIDNVPARSTMFIAKAPQSFRFSFIWSLYQRAKNDGITTIDSAHLLSIYGEKMYTIQSSPNNIKITTPVDYYIFRALNDAMEIQQIFGIEIDNSFV